MTEREKDDLVAAIARSIMGRGGNPYSMQAEFVLDVIEKQGWTLVRKDAQ